MQLKPEHAYHLRALVSEAASLENQLIAKRRELEALAASLGLDPKTQSFVLTEGQQYPLGTVLNTATGLPWTAPLLAETSSNG